MAKVTNLTTNSLKRDEGSEKTLKEAKKPILITKFL